MWHDIFKSKELIINGLDLISFLFVTPRACTSSGSSVCKCYYVCVIFGLLICLINFVLFYINVDHIIHYLLVDENTISLIYGFSIIIGLRTVLIASLKLSERIDPRVTSWIYRSSLLIGIF